MYNLAIGHYRYELSKIVVPCTHCTILQRTMFKYVILPISYILSGTELSELRRNPPIGLSLNHSGLRRVQLVPRLLKPIVEDQKAGLPATTAIATTTIAITASATTATAIAATPAIATIIPAGGT